MKLLRNIYKYKDLFLIFVWREFSIRYKHSLFGILWAVLQPFSMMLLFTFVFTYVMPVKMSDYPYPLFFYSSLLPWSFFSSSINYAVPSLVNHYSLITKIYFPREILPISGIVVALIDFLIASFFLVILFLMYWHPLRITMLWSIPLLFLELLFIIAVALFLSVLNVYYRDVKLATGFLIQLWFFATPVFYTIDKISPRLKPFIFLNPMTFIVENMRRCLVEGRGVIWWQYLIMFIFVSFIFVLSYRFFRITEKRFADVI